MSKTIIFISIFFFFAAVAFCQADNLEMRIFKVKHGSGRSFYDLANELKSQDGKVSFDANTNSIIVFDYPQNLERIASVIESLDVRERQVEIKVLVTETTDEVLSNIGITSSKVIIPSGEFTAVANLLKTNKDTNIRSQMMVRTLSNQPAVLQVTTDEIIGSQVLIYGSGTTVTSPIREPIGNFLEVLPVVNNDGTITVTLRPSVSTLEKGATPSERTILTQAVVNDGDTIAIGGLDSGTQTVQESQTLFGMPLSKKAKSQQKKVVMFLTAKITD